MKDREKGESKGPRIKINTFSKSAFVCFSNRDEDIKTKSNTNEYQLASWFVRNDGEMFPKKKKSVQVQHRPTPNS